MKIPITPLVISFCLQGVASAHGFVRGVTVNGQWSEGSDPTWYYYEPGKSPVHPAWDSLNQNFGYVHPDAYSKSDINCHKSAIPGKSYVNVNSGDTINIVWNAWPPSHLGPIINYLANCNDDCTTISASSLRWTKISQSGLIDPSTETWATSQLTPSNNYTTNMMVPRNLKPGNYVLRHEIIAVHTAWADNGAQHYPQCLNLKVGGIGSVELPPGTAGPLYRRDEPGILFKLDGKPTSYPLPGLEVWSGAD